MPLMMTALSSRPSRKPDRRLRGALSEHALEVLPDGHATRLWVDVRNGDGVICKLVLSLDLVHER